MYGSIKGIAGNAIGTVKALELGGWGIRVELRFSVVNTLDFVTNKTTNTPDFVTTIT